MFNTRDANEHYAFEAGNMPVTTTNSGLDIGGDEEATFIPGFGIVGIIPKQPSEYDEGLMRADWVRRTQSLKEAECLHKADNGEVDGFGFIRCRFCGSDLDK